MENVSPAEELPALYRAVLDGVAELERLGERREASRVRADAVRAYSRSWDAAGRRRLELILRRVERTLSHAPHANARATHQGVVTTT